MTISYFVLTSVPCMNTNAVSNTKTRGQFCRKEPFIMLRALTPKERSVLFIRNLISIKVFLGKPQHPNALHHPRPPGSNGSNFGMSKDGTGVVGIFSESREALLGYEVEPRKYRKEYIDRARAQVEARWRESRVEAEGTGYYGRTRYRLFRHNCQHYVAEILQLADELARKDGVPLIVN